VIARACAAAFGLAVALVASHAAATGCMLELREARADRLLERIALVGPEPRFSIAFDHSVLGTGVVDEYRVAAGRLVLEAERFEGEGYGLPYTAGPGERLERDARGSRLVLDRPIDRLVLRASAAQRTRLLLDGEWPLARPDAVSIELRPVGCEDTGTR